MSNVNNAIVLSDVHLGRENSYLFTENQNYQNNKQALLKALQDLGSQDEVIINGDFFELSLASLETVYHELAEFLEILSQAGPYKRLVYIPGNHDHHYWRLLAEQAVEKRILNKDKRTDLGATQIDRFVDERFSSEMEGLPCRIIFTDLWPKQVDAPEFVVKYPHHMIEVTQAENNTRYFFTHGHFLESRFRPVNILLKPSHLEELEAFNNIWLEFFDYHLGHAGRLSSVALTIVKKYEESKQDAKKLIKEGFAYLYPQMKEKLGHTKAWLLKMAIKLGLRLFPVMPKNDIQGNPLDDKLVKNITDYISNYIIGRYSKEKALELHLPCDKDISTPFHFVFAHTHIPVTGKGKEMRQVSIEDQIFPILNTGGWVRSDESGVYKGENAGILKIDAKGYSWTSMAGKLI